MKVRAPTVELLHETNEVSYSPLNQGPLEGVKKVLACDRVDRYQIRNRGAADDYCRFGRKPLAGVGGLCVVTSLCDPVARDMLRRQQRLVTGI